MSESELYPALILEATRLGHRLWRNNRGRAKYRGRTGDVYTVPYGLCEGAGDLVGFTMIEVGSSGIAVPIFTSVEVKAPGAETKKKLLKEQTDFIAMVVSFGGIAGFVESIEDYRNLVMSPKLIGRTLWIERRAAR